MNTWSINALYLRKRAFIDTSTSDKPTQFHKKRHKKNE